MPNTTYTTTWDLSDYYLGMTDPNLEKDIQKIVPEAQKIADEYRGRMAKLTSQEWKEFLEKTAAARRQINKPALYLFYLNSLDTQNQDVLKWQAVLSNQFTKANNLLLFIDQEMKHLGETQLTALAQDPLLTEYANYFFQQAISVQHLLDEKTEQALNLKHQAGGEIFDSLYEEYVGSFTYQMEIEGRQTTLTEDEVRKLRLSPQESVRRQAVETLQNKYLETANQIALGNVYRAVLKDSSSDVVLRGYPSVMSPRNISEQLEDRTVDLLLDQVVANYPLYHRYLQCKAKNLGKSKLQIWDLSAPLENQTKRYSFEEGVNLVLEVMHSFDSEFYSYYRDMLSRGLIDVFPKAGKRGGAFCSYEDGVESRILLNYTGTFEDISTLAHEMGHAIHGHLRQAQKSQVQSEPLCLAETASVFNETLLNNYYMQSLEGRQRLEFLDRVLMDVFATTYRQVQYVQFERRAHQSMLDGEELTYPDFNRMWREEQEKMTGGLVEFNLPADKETGWSWIPHIFRTPFYCYTYAFGNILAFSLYRQYLQNPTTFTAGYKAILASGGSQTPADLLALHGLDINQPEFYMQGIRQIQDYLDEYERLSLQIK